ncbi:MAG: hypothetical protein GTO49_13225, partial [Anaerolineae bacterium]|nr:hypothetical protein [Anaerolineae bacterium]
IGTLLRTRLVLAIAAVLWGLGLGISFLGTAVDFNLHYIAITEGNYANEARIHFFPWASPIAGHVRHLVAGGPLAFAATDLSRFGFPRILDVVFPPAMLATSAASVVWLSRLSRTSARYGRHDLRATNH